MHRVSHVTSSGFIFEKSESTIVIRCPRPLVPLAELEYLREVEGAEFKGGRIADIRRTSGDGRELHLVTVEMPQGGARTLIFDAGPAFLGYFRQVTTGLMYVVYGLAAILAIGTLAYIMVRFVAR